MGCAESREAQPQDALHLTSQRQQAQQEEIKVVLLGDSGVGKSSLALRFTQNRFSPFHEVTIGAAFLRQLVRLPHGRQAKLHIWDTGGQERFRAMAPLYYRDAPGAVVVYDSTDAKSFESVHYWIEQLRANGPQDVCVVVAGNKCDVGEPAVQPSDARQWCESQGIDFFETSAKTGSQVAPLFEKLTANVVERRMR